MINTIDFTASLIKSRQVQIKESLNRKKVKESKEEEPKTKIIKEDVDEPEAEVETEVEVKDEPESEVIQDAEGFEETIQDTVHFCVQCNKHFLASPDTPDDEIVCPICGEKELVVDMGTAEEALEEKENEEVAQEISVEDEEMSEPEVSEDEFEFDETDLEEGLRCLARKYVTEKALLKIKKGFMKNGNLVLEGAMFPGRKKFSVVFENLSKNMKSGSKRFVLEGKTNLFKANKLKGLFVVENNVIKLKKCGYGLIKESKNGKTKVKGILG